MLLTNCNAAVSRFKDILYCFTLLQLFYYVATIRLYSSLHLRAEEL